MKSYNSLLQRLFPVFLILLLAVLAAVMLKCDKSGLDRRSAYEAGVRNMAMEFCAVNGMHVKAGTDNPAAAALQEFVMTMDPAEGRVPSERLATAYRQASQAKKLKSGDYALQWTGTSTEMGGRTRSLMWDPNAANGRKVWAAGVTGGLWYISDITSSFDMWQPVSDLWENISVSSICYDPNNKQVFYAGTGEAQTAFITYRESSGRGVGIWKSTNGGTSWTLLPSTSGFAYVTDVAVRAEGNTSVIYAAVVSGTYKGQQHQSQPGDGLFRSADGGQTWTQVLPDIIGSNKPYSPSDIAIGAGGRLYVGTMANLDKEGGATILYSDQGTPGSWTIFDAFNGLIASGSSFNIPGRVVLAPSPSNANILYAAIAAGNESAGTNPVYKGFFIVKTTDKGNDWVPVNLPGGSEDWANLAWHAMTLTVDPNDPDQVYAGGLDVWRTQDGGENWDHLSDWSLMYYGGGDAYVHADQHAMAYKPGSSSELLFGCDGGVFYTNTAGNPIPVFIQKNLNYNTLQFYTCAMHPGAGENKYLGGLQDNGTLLYDGTPLSIFSMVDGGDGAYCFWDRDEENIYITSYYYNRYSIYNGGNQVNWIDNYSGIFINPADYNHTTNTLFANLSDYWGYNANKILRVPNIPNNGNGAFVNVGTDLDTWFSHVKVSPHSTGLSTTLFLGSNSGRLFKVTNAQSTPQKTEIGSPSFPTANISCVAVGGSEDTLLVTFSNYGVSSVWQTYDGGQNWREIEGNLPDMPVRWAIYYPGNARQVLLATELGVWYSPNAHAEEVTWTPQNDGMPSVRVDMLNFRASDNRVLAASHGRGLFTCTFGYDNTTRLEEPGDPGFRMFQDYSSGKLVITSGDPAPRKTELTILSPEGHCLLSRTLVLSGGRTEVNLPADYHGVAVARAQAGRISVAEKILVR